VFLKTCKPFLIIATNILDSKKEIIEARIARGEDSGDATIFEHFLAKENLTIEEIYTNMTELLLSGVDTVSFEKSQLSP